MRGVLATLWMALVAIGGCGRDGRAAAEPPVTPERAAPLSPRATAPSAPSAPPPTTVAAAPIPAPSAAPAQPTPGSTAAPPEIARPYDEQADANADIARAVEQARAEDKRVLLVFGGNWCPWCRRLEHTFRNEPRVRDALAAGFRVVHIDTGARRSGRNAAINERYGNPMQNGLPVLVVLGPDGQARMTQETGALENGDRHDPERVLAFLSRARQ
ncbi:MAG: thioredoxin family protein [Microbacteriaceae bacterium]|nr:thioredoxin family protein [Microbacteriaceae bacterium]